MRKQKLILNLIQPHDQLTNRLKPAEQLYTCSPIAFETPKPSKKGKVKTLTLFGGGRQATHLLS